MAELPLPSPGSFVDDNYFCCIIRKELEQKYNFKVAPEEIADQFSYERHTPDQPTFGFHGIFNYWRHVSDAEMEKIPHQFEDLYVTSIGYAEVLVRYYAARKSDVFAAWYGRMRDLLGLERTKEHLSNVTKNPKFVDAIVQTGEMVLSEAQQLRDSA